MGGRPAVLAAPVSLTEGPILEERVYRIGTWGTMSDAARIRKLRRLAEDYGNDPRLRWFVVSQVLGGVEGRDFRGQLNAIFQWVQNNIHYTNESTEQIQAPWWTIRHRTGDCDDMALLLAAMLTSIGHPFRFALAGQHRRTGQFVRWVETQPPPGPVDYTHIYLFGGDVPLDPAASTWWAMEPTIKGLPLGHDVTQHGVPGNAGADVGAPRAYGAVPAYGAPILSPEAAMRADSVDALRALPPLAAVREVGVPTFVTDWIDWHRISGSVVEGALSALILTAVLAAVGLRGGAR